MDEFPVGTVIEAISEVNNSIALGGLNFTQAAPAIAMYTGIAGIIVSVASIALPDKFKGTLQDNFSVEFSAAEVLRAKQQFRQRTDNAAIIMQQLGNLKNAVSQMHEEMRQDFRSVESLIEHHNFTKNIINKVDNQQRYLENLLGTPSNQSIEQFKHECNTRRPQILLVDIISAIDRDVNNPIKYCLNEDPLNSREIVIKWRKEIQGLAGTLAMLHGVFSGLNGWKDDGMMAANIKELGRVLDEFEQNFKLDYWSSVESFVERTMDRNVSNMEKAENITNMLDKIYTTDQFLILVYDSTEGSDNHVFHVRNESQALFRFRRGGSCVVVYASKTIRNISDDALQQYVEDWSKSLLPRGYTLAGRAKWLYEEQYGQFPLSDDVWKRMTEAEKQEFLLLKAARNYGFVGGVRNSLNIVYCNTKGRLKGGCDKVEVREGYESHFARLN